MQQVFNLFQSRFFATLVILTLLSACGGSGSETEKPAPTPPTPADITAPVITLNGESSITLFLNNAYSELGASAVDDRDGSIDVVISGTVDTSTLGSYTITYTATDSANNISTIIRTVDVIPVPDPVISKIDVFSEPTEGGQLLRAYPSCDNCIAESYQYNWIIDGVSVSSVASYSLTYSDFNKKIQIEIQGSNEVNVTTSAYQIIEVQPEFRFSQIYSNGKAFAALKNDGTVVTWGNVNFGGDSSSVADKLNNVAEIYSNINAFAAIKEDGTVITWGHGERGGDSSSIVDQLTNVIEIYSSDYVFAALKNDGTVITWGENSHGGDSSSVTDQLTNVIEIYSSKYAFAALKNDGTVVTWGDDSHGGDSSAVTEQLTNIIHIIPFRSGFIATKNDGAVVTWGEGPNFSIGVSKVVSTPCYIGEGFTYAALKINGTVVTWGNGDSCFEVSSLTQPLTNVAELYSNYGALAALKNDGTVVTWGSNFVGGYYSSWLAEQLTNVTEIYATDHAFAALKSDGTVVTWGSWRYDGVSSSVTEQLTNVTEIYATDDAFAALKNDGTVVTWGNDEYGGDSSVVQSKLTNVAEIYAIDLGFAALRHDSSIIFWGSNETSANYHAPFTDEIRPKSSSINIVKILHNPRIVLNGHPTKNVLINSTYSELGAIAIDDLDSNVEVVISGTVDTSTLGSYTITYTATDSDNYIGEAIRIVNVIEADNSAPEITLNGDNTITVLLNESYVELGANAVDDIDGIAEVIISGYVDTTVAGRYSTTYSTTDMANNTNSIIRTIDVVHPVPQIDVLDITQSKTEQGYLLQALISCTDCITSNHQYTWTIDGIAVADTDHYVLTKNDVDKILHIEVSVSNEKGSTDTAYQLVTINSSRQSIELSATRGAFAALKDDGTVVSWGDTRYGADSSSVADQLTNVIKIYSNKYAFAALKQDGTVVSWGDTRYGGYNLRVQNQLTNVTEIFSTDTAFAALKNDGTVVAWGHDSYGGDSSIVAEKLDNVIDVFSTFSAFAALKNDGTVVSWGNRLYGADSSAVAEQLTNVIDVSSTFRAFSALKSDGTVVTWGHEWNGGDNSAVAEQLTNVIKIYSNYFAFAVLKSDGSVVTWGRSDYGGDSAAVTAQLTNVIKIYSNDYAFAALKSDGSVVSWGDSRYGADSSAVADQLTNVIKIYSNDYAFAALKSDGSVVLWGDSRYGADSSAVAAQLTNVIEIYSNDYAFAALKYDGSVVAWGHSVFGGDSSAVTAQLTNVIKIYSNVYAFAALRNDGTVITWGLSDYGGNGSSNAVELSPYIHTVIPNAPVVTLNGEPETTLMLGDTYSELGASSLDDVDSDVEVVISGAVDTSVPGTYIVTYRVTDSDNNISIVTRKVTVLPIDNVAPAISLNGANSIELFANNTYSELGANAYDDRDGVIDAVISGEVDTTTLGTYTVTYTATDSSNNSSHITRTVHIIADTIAPNITLNGDSEVMIVINKIYTELGATAIDNNDGEVEVVISGIVDTSILGSYTVTYTATDSANNSSSIIRKVDIVEPYPPIINDITIVTELTELGHQLRADIDCTECIIDSHQYAWTIDGELVSTEQSYLLTPDNYHKKIQVEVVVNGDEDLSNSAYKTYLSDNVQVIDIYAISGGFAALRNDGTVVTWASCDSVVPDINTIKQIHSNDGIITILTNEDTVVTWECIDHGADVKRDLTNVAELFFNGGAFAALKNDGAVVTWGHSTRGGDSSSVADNLTNVIEIFYTSRAFAALKSDGSFVTWGESDYGGDSSSVTYDLTNTVEVVPNNQAFAALKNDGTVVTWGSSTGGGDSNSVSTNLTDVVKIRSLEAGFSVLKSDGSAIIWGDEYLAHGSTIDLTNVVEIYGNEQSYAALKSDGTVVSFGYESDDNILTDVVEIYPRSYVFYALKNDGSVESFNVNEEGLSSLRNPGLVANILIGYGDDESLLSWVIGRVNLHYSDNTNNVADLVSNNESTLYLWSDGKMELVAPSWSERFWDYFPHATNVASIYSNGAAYAALKNNGAVIALHGSYGANSNLGGDSSAVADELLPTITLADVPNAPLLRFNGDKEITLRLNDTYTELGVTAKDDVDDSVQVIVSGTVDTATAGVYSITYTATDSDSNEASITRTINVVLP